MDLTPTVPNIPVPIRAKLPELVSVKINGSEQVLKWQVFIDLLICTHEFETNIYPRCARSGNVEIKLL